jgi:hypothetical protein
VSQPVGGTPAGVGTSENETIRDLANDHSKSWGRPTRFACISRITRPSQRARSSPAHATGRCNWDRRTRSGLLDQPRHGAAGACSIRRLARALRIDRCRPRQLLQPRPTRRASMVRMARDCRNPAGSVSRRGSNAAACRLTRAKASRAMSSRTMSSRRPASPTIANAT